MRGLLQEESNPRARYNPFLNAWIAWSIVPRSIQHTARRVWKSVERLIHMAYRIV